MLKRRNLLLGFISTSAFGIAGCATGSIYKDLGREAKNYNAPFPKATKDFPKGQPFPSWTAADDSYRLYPGDKIEIYVRGEEELSKSLTVAPDGRITPNRLPSIYVADKTPDEVSAIITNLYSNELKNPEVTISPSEFASQKIFVGGEVQKPGIYQIEGEMDPIQAITLAGGFLPSAKRDETAVLRRGAGGQPFMRVYNLKNVFAKNDSLTELPRLRRFDVIWVPRSRISEVGLFTQQFIKDALPIAFVFNYSMNGYRY